MTAYVLVVIVTTVRGKTMHRYLLTFSGRIWGSHGQTELTVIGVYAESRVKAELVLDDYFDRIHLLELKEI